MLFYLPRNRTPPVIPSRTSSPTTRERSKETKASLRTEVKARITKREEELKGKREEENRQLKILKEEESKSRTSKDDLATEDDTVSFLNVAIIDIRD